MQHYILRRLNGVQMLLTTHLNSIYYLSYVNYILHREYLGVTISHDLCLEKHLNKITKKANITLLYSIALYIHVPRDSKVVFIKL